MLLLFKEDKHDVWMGTILLSGGMVGSKRLPWSVG